MNNQLPKIFLTAEWRWLAMLNYEIAPEVLMSFVPAGTELDSWNRKTFVSMVGFMFLKTRVKGIPIPFHQNFEEVNLRFYVRRKADDGWRRGVVFIKEIVPRTAIALVARNFYNENYQSLPMSHQIEKSAATVKSAAYLWRFKRSENHLKITTQGEAQPLTDGCVQEFITEHYWGYARQRDGSTMEYHVEHPRWNVWEAQSSSLRCDVIDLYGSRFAECLNLPPSSAFLADGSEVKVYSGQKV